MRRLATAVLVLLLAGCSLPLPHGVRSDVNVPERDTGRSDIQVLPPAPRKGAQPKEIVQGFLGAQSSPQGRHAIARTYLDRSSATRWQGDEAVFYDPASLRVELTSSEPGAAVVETTFTVLGSRAVDGRYLSRRPGPFSETYGVTRGQDGQWRISNPPLGLRLTPADRDRSFRPQRLYYVSPSPERFRRMVPDLVLLPVSERDDEVALQRLLLPPSAALSGSVRSAFPAGTRLLSVSSDGGGLVRVDLSAEVARASVEDRQLLSAQLVWTLRALDPTFQRLRLTAAGRLLQVAGEGDVQMATDWRAYDPESAPGPLYFVAAGRVRTATSAGAQGAGPEALRDVVVADLAVSPDRTQLAVLQPAANGQVTVRMGGTASPSHPVVLRRPDLTTPSFGSGEFGLWMADGTDQVLVARPSGPPLRVPVEGVHGPVSALAASRDGVRVALVSRGVLYVGRVARGSTGLRVVHAVKVSPRLTGVTDVVWRDSTTLVALGNLSGTFLPTQLSLDGASVQVLSPSGLPSQPMAAAAQPDGVVVTASGHLYLLSALGFRKGPVGSAPVYPG
ncbi:MAG: Lipoprotein LpqB, beta-propeller domain-like protein [Frankiales bacterium]|nr:Lipoprotein LpqB, beta-propeller domain-like protein [Frankiales bacterium]